MRATSYLAIGLLALTGVAVVAAPAHATITGTSGGGVMTVSSDAASDTMVFTCGVGGLLVNGVSPFTSSLPCNGTNALSVLGNGGDDVIDISALDDTSISGITVDGGDGNDQVTGGGFVTGNTGTVTISGGAGNDTMIGHRSDVVLGGPGDDVLSDFGIDGQLINGEAGTDTYRLDLSPFSPIAIDLTPLNGGLVVSVGGGAATLFSWASIEAVDLTMNEGNNAVSTFAFSGVARVVGNGGNDTLTGGNAADSLDAGPGNDTVEGGGGADSIVAGDGDDVVKSSDQVADNVNCGSGNDVAVSDPADTLAGCETVSIPPQPIAPDSTKPTPSVGKAKLKGSKVKVAVRCPATELRCVGSAVLKATGKVDGKKQSYALGKVLVIANGGKSAALVVKVDKQTRKQLAKLDKAKLVVAYDVMDVAGNIAKGKATVKLKV